MEIRPVCGKILWFPVGTVMGASEINDEDIWRIYTNMWKQLEVCSETIIEKEVLVANGDKWVVGY